MISGEIEKDGRHPRCWSVKIFNILKVLEIV